MVFNKFYSSDTVDFSTLAATMSATIDSFNKRRLRSSYASVIVSISLVLFLLGLLGLLLLNADALSREIRETFTIKLMLKENEKEAAVS